MAIYSAEPKFFLKREDSKQHGGVRIHFMAHVPRNLTEIEALTLAAELVKNAGGPAAFGPVLTAAYGSPEAVQKAIDEKLLAQKTLTPADETKDAETE